MGSGLAGLVQGWVNACHGAGGAMIVPGLAGYHKAAACRAVRYWAARIGGANTGPGLAGMLTGPPAGC